MTTRALRRALACACTLLAPACTAPEPITLAPALNNREALVSLLLAGDAASAIREGLHGTAEVFVEVDETGRVAAYRLVQPVGDPRVDAALARLAGAMTFDPSTREGVAVRSSITIPFAFGGGTVR